MVSLLFWLSLWDGALAILSNRKERKRDLTEEIGCLNRVVELVRTSRGWMKLLQRRDFRAKPGWKGGKREYAECRLNDERCNVP